MAGELGGRRLEAPPGTATRPTTERVREAVFNALGSMSLVRDAIVLDLFAGTGAMGIEALSRGAARCTFVERDRRVAQVLRDNVSSLGLDDRARVVVGDSLAAASAHADLALADPPYDFAAWPALLSTVGAPLLVIEAGEPFDRLVTPDDPARRGWQVTRERRYGRTWVTFLDRIAEVA